MNLLGKLSWDAIPLDQPIIMGATAFMVLVIVAVLAFITLTILPAIIMFLMAQRYIVAGLTAGAVKA